MAKKTTGKLRSYSSDVSEEEWEFCVHNLTLMKEKPPQCEYTLRAVSNSLRWMVRAGCPWRLLPADLPPWTVVHQLTLRRIGAGCFEAMAHDLRMIIRELSARASPPTAVVLDGRTVRSTPESGAPAGYDGHKRRKAPRCISRSIPWGILLVLKVTSANAQERAQVWGSRRRGPRRDRKHVQIGYVEQGYNGAEPAAQAAQDGHDLIGVQLP